MSGLAVETARLETRGIRVVIVGWARAQGFCDWVNLSSVACFVIVKL